MKRDLDVIRDILLALEAQAATNIGLRAAALPQHHADAVNYNMALLIDQGYVRGSVSRSLPKPPVSQAVIYELEWAGHDLVDAIRSPDVYQRTKSVLEKVGSFTIDIVKQTAAAIAAEMIRKAMGQ